MNEVRVEKVGNRILIASAGKLGGLASSIPGAYYRKDGFWSVALEFENCLLLRERFGSRLVVGPALSAWAREEKAHRAEQKATAGAIDAELKRLGEVAPKLAAAMESRTYQKTGVRFIVNTRGRDGRRRTLLADTVGLGKTAEALGACLESGVPGPYLIVTPKTSVNSTWKAEIHRWLPGDEVITIPDGRAARDSILNSLVERSPVLGVRASGASLARTWVVIHPAAIRTQTWWICDECGSQTKYTRRPTQQLDCGHEKARSKTWHDHTFPQLFALEYGGIVIDESHDILIMKTGTPNLQRTGADLLGARVVAGGVRLAMSGTPTRSKPHQLWSTLNWLDPIRYSGKWRFLEKYWKVSQAGYGGSYVLGEFREDREQMLYEELSDILLRREREQVRADLPPKNYMGAPLDPADEGSPVGIWLEMTPKQEKLYRQIEKSAEVTLEGGTLSPIGVLAELTRLKQFASAGGVVVDGEFVMQAEGNKYEWLVGFMRQLGFPEEPATKLVFASQFTSLLKAFGPAIEKEFGCRVEYITGDETQARRDANIAEFEDPESELQVLFLNTKAGGSSITLDAADVMVIDDETWVDDEQEQLEGRIDNRNPERKIVPRAYYYLRSLGTVEESIAIKNANAKAVGKKLMDGIKPADLAQKLLKR